MRYTILLILIFSFSELFSQRILSHRELNDPANKDKGKVVAAVISENDTILQVYLRPIIIFPPRKFKNKREKRRYSRMVRYVKKMYPYSLAVAKVFNEVQIAIDTIPSRKEQRRFLKKKERELKKEFEDDIKKMTYTQGRILIKLVDRQTGYTSYEIIKQFKGSVTAIFWQSVARIFSTNLKYEFDAEGEDKWIEEIVAKIENGQL